MAVNYTQPDTGRSHTVLKTLLKRLGAGHTPGDIDARYQRALDASSRGEIAAAIELAQSVIAIEPGLAAPRYLLGCCLEEQGDLAAAAKAFGTCIELKPDYPIGAQASAHIALCHARLDLDAGKQAALMPLPRGTKPSLSVIVCSANTARLDETQRMYRNLLQDVEHELIGIQDARSLAEGYNRGLKTASGDIVVLAHDDAQILNTDFAARLLDALSRHDIVGVAGAYKLKGAAWHFAGHPDLCGQIAMPGDNLGRITTLYGINAPECARLQALDGVFLAARRDTAIRVGFDEETFDNWDLYDIDFSYRAAQMGLDCATCNSLLLVHASQGGYNAHWLECAQRFLDKHRASLGPIQPVLEQPQLVSLHVRSTDEWRLLTERLTGAAPEN
jgi:tetratricopeptide (TPR) repeat protein